MCFDDMPSRRNPMARERTRLNTFQNWPNPNVAPADLAKEGFFFLKSDDKVQCAFCHGVVGDWEEGDIPEAEHRKHFRGCPFVRGLNVGNEPLSAEEQGNGHAPASGSPGTSWNGDVTGRSRYEMLPGSRESRTSDQQLQALGILTHSPPVHPSYATFEKRRASFRLWPRNVPVSANALAEAGFFYAGVEDYVTCFSCNGGLNNWQVNDNPWIEHARWFENCNFLKLTKGHSFIEKAKASNSLKQTKTEQTQTTRVPVEDLEKPGTSAAKHTISDLEKENQELKEMTLCKICFDKELGVVFLPCGHLSSCTDCASSVTLCPICRSKVSGTVRTYLS